MQQPYPPRLQINPPHHPLSGGMLSSPGGVMFASPAAYSAHAFGAGALLSPDLPGQGAYFPLPHGGLHSAPQLGRQVSLSSTGSPLTPVPSATLASPFFPASAPPARSPPSLSYAPPPYPPSRRTTLHAATPSFHPSQPARGFLPGGGGGGATSAPPRGHGKRESVSIAALRVGDDPLRSPTLSRAGSGSASPALPVRRDEPKRKKVVVRLPREAADDLESAEAAPTGARSAIVRVPLEAEGREVVEAEMACASEAVDAAAREQHPDEVKAQELPPEVDVYLPGRTAWEEVWETFEAEMKEKHGYCDIRRPSFLPPVRGSPSPVLFDSLFPRRSGHGRTASLFSTSPASLPPRLQSVLDTVRRVGNGHGPSLSLSFPSSLSALRSPSLGSPALSPGPAPNPQRLTPLAPSFVPSSALETAAATPLPRSPLGSPEQQQQLPLESTPAKPEKWRPSLHELGRGFGIEEEEEDGGALAFDEAAAEAALVPEEAVASVEAAQLESHAPVLDAAQDDDEPVEDAKPAAKDTPAVDPDQDGRRSEPPSRRASGVSTRTDHTGVASLSGRSWTDASDLEVDDDKAENEHDDGVAVDKEVDDAVVESRAVVLVDREREESPALSHELSRALTDLGPLELHDALLALPPLPAVKVEVDDAYDLSDDSQYGDAELTGEEYSNPSDEEAARERALVRARSVRALREQALKQSRRAGSEDDDDLPLASLALRVPGDVLFEAPSDVDRTDIEDSPSKRPDHKVTQNFEFPPRSPGSSPVKPRQPAQIALPESSPDARTTRSSLPPLAPLLVSPRSSLDFGESLLPYVLSPSFARRTSEPSSHEVFAFGSFGQPGSLAASPSLPPDSPAVPPPTSLNPTVDEFRPQTAAAQASSTLKPTAVEFKPTLARSLPSSFGNVAPTSFDFLPPADAPTLSFVESETSAPPSRHVSGSHGPLPPIPLTTVAPHAASIKRQKVEDDSWLPTIGSVPMQRVVSAPVLAHPQPRRPLPEPPVALHDVSEPASGDEVELLRDDLDLALDERDPAEESEVGNRSFVSVDDPLPEQYAPSRPVVGRRAAADAPPAPKSRPFSLRAAPAVSADGRVLGFRPAGGANGVRAPLPAFSDDERAQEASPARMGDPRARKESVDIALPTSLRAKSKAISLSHIKARDVFDGMCGVVASPATSPPPGSSSSMIEASVVSHDEDEDDLPLRILENLISAHFDDLKAELALSRDQHKPEADDLVDKLGARVELLLATQQLAPGSVTPALEAMLDGAHKRIEQLVAGALERTAVDGASAGGRPRRPTLLDPNRPTSAPPLRPSTPLLIDVGGPALAYGAFIEDLQRTVQPLVRDPLEPEVLAAKIAAALQPQVTELLATLQQQAPSTASSQVTVVDPLALEKVNQILEPALAQLSVLEGLAEAVASAVVARVGTAAANGVHDEQLVQAEAGLGAPSPHDSLRSTLQALKMGQEQLADALKGSQDEQAALKSAIGQHRHDFTSHQDFAFTKLEEFLKTHLGGTPASNSAADAAKIVDLEAQLSKARNEHGKARSEKAVLQDRLEADRTRHASEVSELRAQLAQQAEALKTVEREKQDAREALAASKGEVSGLEKRLAAQDARLDALQRAKTVQQQSLALANQRNTEHVAALASACARISELETASSAADDKVNALEEENVAYRAKFAALEQGLEAMKTTVKGELDDAAARIASLTAERDRLAEENDRLARAAYDEAPPTPRQAHRPVPLIYPSPPSPPAFSGNGNGASNGHGLAALVPHHTGTSDGSDDTVAHTEFSPTPSVSGQSVYKDERDGWWSAVAE
ncbi:hypothetical protein JCM10449v2_006335 [Rhodotorula kratochvilovae]